MTKINAYEEICREADAFSEKLVSVITNLIKTQAQQIFDKYPEVESVAWDQWTPYYNDGDPCNFNVYDDYPYVNNISMENFKKYDPDECIYVWTGDLPEDAFEEVKELIANFREEHLQLLGEGQILITKERLSVDTDVYHD